MIIYIYQGMMALGKGGGSIMGELRREMQEVETGVRSVKKLFGVKQMLIKRWHQQNVH